MPFKDARDYQILFLSVFLLLGILTRDWTLSPILIPTAIATCLISQIFLTQLFDIVKGIKAQNLSPYPIHSLNYRFFEFLTNSSWKSALITALGLCLLLRANHYQTMIVAGSLAIGSKFIFSYRGKHFFNPANFGIIAALILTQDGWVSPGQWGHEGWYLLLFMGLGGIVLKRVGRWDTSVTFLVTYFILEVIRNAYLGWSWDVVQHQFMSGSLLLFALFMLTDPRSIPNATIGRLIWAIAIALLTFILHHVFYLSTAIFWALFILSPITLLLDYIWKDYRFSWQDNRPLVINL
ncbi:MAG: RnfABCDGE type electron transport complex subunit D [Microcystaceae cyanobacterium]